MSYSKSPYRKVSLNVSNIIRFIVFSIVIFISEIKLIMYYVYYRYIQLLHQKLYQLASSDYEEYVGILFSAYGAFAMTPEGISMFKEWLQTVRR